ncbi:hypothetical protein GGU10DRAFT_402288 [Lentinula aff. detonsa]|uniref:Uncharacterized protein n=1 Tax=Lentinula aff. detonsa TaxID=2804958 RepID=A0AA38NCI6_9AGAR|nr:hypothetical protein GGU10DRAFT_402288 [Lentinula aff. detonsa]
MSLIRSFLGLSCRLDFSFASLWLSSSENSLADAASRFAYTRLFKLAPYLNPQPSSKRLRLGGTITTPNLTKPSHSIFGMASPPVPEKPTPQANDLSSTTCDFTACTTATAPSSLPLKMPSFTGSPTLEDALNPRLSKLTSPTSAPCIPMSISPSLPPNHLSSSALFGESNVTMVNEDEIPNNPSPCPSSPSSSPSSAQPLSPGISTSSQLPAQLTPGFLDVESSLYETARSSVPPSILPQGACNSSLTSTTLPESTSHCPPRKLTPSVRGSPSSLPQLMVHLPAL